MGRFVEFEYALGDGVLSVELILPPAAFEEFCRSQHAVVLPLASETAQDLARLAWRSGHPGLLRHTAGDDSDRY